MPSRAVNIWLLITKEYSEIRQQHDLKHPESQPELKQQKAKKKEKIQYLLSYKS
jgi:hypothetical protein